MLAPPSEAITSATLLAFCACALEPRSWMSSNACSNTRASLVLPWSPRLLASASARYAPSRNWMRISLRRFAWSRLDVKRCVRRATNAPATSPPKNVSATVMPRSYAAKDKRSGLTRLNRVGSRARRVRRRGRGLVEGWWLDGAPCRLAQSGRLPSDAHLPPSPDHLVRFLPLLAVLAFVARMQRSPRRDRRKK